MPFFNFRRGGSNAAPTAGSAVQTESVEVVRKRAKHRLIGSAVLVLIGVVGFPLLFDTQPRPIAVDIPIEIPAKGTVKPLAAPAPSEKVAATASLAPQEEILPSKQAAGPVTPAPAAIKSEAKPESKAEPKPEPKSEPKPEVKAEPKAAPKPAAASDDAVRASALLSGSSAPAGKVAEEAAGRVVVQVGAFADVAKAREARLKLEKAGLKTYTQVAETKDGKRIRVRVGPFASRAEAETAASKIKALDLPAAILTL
ncbi:SPOR domain-containing protein [Polaromonas sp. JS666]|uniref:SPOR domain-containing protein n=1 Tax=Polaromonas sp. (strain JS666 / ATCC BAA-500) TaxID=296591 RepID=UPI0000536875|nr:SPOR domain-containing protein [Polaromonas sp. JS666]ABE43543.1 Sporulation related protein [Polaromonas sp. JS666]